jgi:hypothetical protein
VIVFADIDQLFKKGWNGFFRNKGAEISKFSSEFRPNRKTQRAFITITLPLTLKLKQNRFLWKFDYAEVHEASWS